MKTKFSTEDLIHSLPDYITNGISDLDLNTQIENELKNNASFKLEYDELRNTLGFLNTSDLEVPSDTYFNNLSVKINDRIINESIGKGFWERLGLAWKILIPVIPAIIIAIVLFSNFQEEKIISITAGNEKDKTEISNKKNNTNEKTKEVTKTDNEVKSDQTKFSVKETVQSKNYSGKTKYTGKRKKQIQSSDNQSTELNNETIIKEDVTSNALLSSNIEIFEEEANESDEDILYLNESNEEEDSLEEEFLNLPLEQQKEIIENLNKTQI